MNKPHKWAEVIKAWADGKTVQWQHTDDVMWVDYINGTGVGFNDSAYIWRVKPELKTPGEGLREAWYAALKMEVPRSEVNFNQWQVTAIEFLRAYKAGELKE